jgi:hypothetical protein
MLKLIGAVTVGFLTVAAAAYFTLRPKADRTTDLHTAKNLFSHGLAGIKQYFDTLLNPAPRQKAF